MKYVNNKNHRPTRLQTEKKLLINYFYYWYFSNYTRKANIELKDSDFTTPLHVASKHGHLEAISWLLKFKCDVTETDKDDRTCLMWAADENQTEAIKVFFVFFLITLMFLLTVIIKK